MNFLRWIAENRPGGVEDFGDRVEVRHTSGEHSTLWRGDTGDPVLSGLYGGFVGADLFSSAFKIASVGEPLCKNGVELVGTVSQLERELNSYNPDFGENVVPFMTQAGIGIYALGRTSGAVYEWDTETNELSDKFESLADVFDEWIQAIS